MVLLPERSVRLYEQPIGTDLGYQRTTSRAGEHRWTDAEPASSLNCSMKFGFRAREPVEDDLVQSWVAFETIQDLRSCTAAVNRQDLAARLFARGENVVKHQNLCVPATELLWRAIQPDLSHEPCLGEQTVKQPKLAVPRAGELRMKPQRGADHGTSPRKTIGPSPGRGRRRHRKDTDPATLELIGNCLGVREQIEVAVKIDHATP